MRDSASRGSRRRAGVVPSVNQLPVSKTAARRRVVSRSLLRRSREEGTARCRAPERRIEEHRQGPAAVGIEHRLRANDDRRESSAEAVEPARKSWSGTDTGPVTATSDSRSSGCPTSQPISLPVGSCNACAGRLGSCDSVHPSSLRLDQPAGERQRAGKCEMPEQLGRLMAARELRGSLRARPGRESRRAHETVTANPCALSPEGRPTAGIRGRRARRPRDAVPSQPHVREDGVAAQSLTPAERERVDRAQMLDEETRELAHTA